MDQPIQPTEKSSKPGMGFLIIILVILAAASYFLVQKNPTAPKITFEVGQQGCEGENPSSLYSVLNNSSEVASVLVPFCASNVKIVKETADYVYFSIPPDDMGGYILYDNYGKNLYQLDLKNWGVTPIIQFSKGGYIITDLDINNNATLVVYKSDIEQQIAVKNLQTSEEKLYKSPENTKDAQIGSFKFSPNSTKIAFAAGYGPENERGEVYILDLNTGESSLYKTTDAPPYITGWADDNSPVIK